MATTRQERREAASSESKWGRAGMGAPAPRPEERRTERPSGAVRHRAQRGARRSARAAGRQSHVPGSAVPRAPTYFPWRRTSGGVRQAAEAVGVAGRRRRAVAEAAVEAAAPCRACSLPGPHCAWRPRAVESSGRVQAGITRGRGTATHAAPGLRSPPRCVPSCVGRAALPRWAPGACSSHLCSAAC